MPEQQRYARDPKKHRAISLKSYRANRSEISQRRKERYHLQLAAKGIVVDPAVASRMSAMREAPRRVLQQSWTNNLFERMSPIIAENAGSPHTRKTLRWAFRLILTRAEKDGLAEEHQITPAWLAGIPWQTKDRLKEPIYRANFGRVLMRLELWSEKDLQLFRMNLAASKRRVNPDRRPHRPKAASAPPTELCQLVRELAGGCGLSTGEMRELRVMHIQANGLRIPPTPNSEQLLRLVAERNLNAEDLTALQEKVQSFLPMREPQWAPSTRETNLYNVNQHILPALGAVPLARLDKFKCQMFLNDLARPRKGVAHGFSFTVIDHNRTMLKAILEEAVDAELIGKNPASKLVPKLGRFIPFGDGWDELSKATLDAYVREEKPTDYLFFSRSPRDKSKPLSTMTLNGAVIASGTTIKALCDRHFEEDFNRARSLQEARSHLRNVHHLENQHAHSMIAGSRSWKGYANEARTIPVPEPYLFAAMCASRSVPEDRAQSHFPKTGGGKRHLITWHDLFDYEITLDWTCGFAKELSGRGEKVARALRLMYCLAFDFWFAGRRMKLPDIEDSEIRREDKDLLREFAATRVIVRDSQGSWEGGVFEYNTRQHSFRIPLIEEMNGRAWHNQCLVCWHPERDNIEREIAEAATKETREKGYSIIANKYGVSYQSLKGHSGRRVPRPGRGETQRSHFSTGPKALTLRCPRSFFKQLPKLSEMDLMIYTLVLVELHRADTLGLIVSAELIRQRLDLRLDDSQLSFALNHLGPTNLALVNFKKVPKGFYVVLTK
jgi:hypothetical protein